MRSVASFKTHPLHPILISFPIAFLIGGTVAELVGKFGDLHDWSIAASYLPIAGIVTALLAAVRCGPAEQKLQTYRVLEGDGQVRLLLSGTSSGDTAGHAITNQLLHAPGLRGLRSSRHDNAAIFAFS